MTAHISTFTPAELQATERKQSLLQAMLFMAITFLIIGIHVVLTAGFSAPGYIWLVCATLASLFISPHLALALMFSMLIFQNAFVSMASPLIPDYSEYKLLLAGSFLNICLTSLVCLPVWLKLRVRFAKESWALLRWMAFFFAVIALYAALGASRTQISDVMVYVRMYGTGGLLLAIGLAYGFQVSQSYLVNIIRVVAALLVVWGFLEFAFSYDLYSFFHVVDFFHLKYAGTSSETEMFNSINDVIEFSSRSYLNLTGTLGLNLELLRPNGPNLHPISYAYSLAFCCLICFIYRSYVLTVGCAILVALVGAKGPLIMVVMCLTLYCLYNRVRNPRWLIVAMGWAIAAYVTIGLVYGVITSDFHTIGFLGGIHGFVLNPLGHGIGVGGTLSQAALGEKLTDLQFFQGFGADYGFESAMGVLIYQIGIGISVFLFFYYQLWKATWQATLHFSDEPRRLIVPIALAFLLANGIFQEEALSPVGWGLWLFYSGFLIAQYWMDKEAHEDARAPIQDMHSAAG